MKPQISSTKEVEKLNIIAIGASAGGLEALQEFLSHLPEFTNTAIIIAQHLSPTHKSLLVQLLSKQTKLSVAEAKNNTLLAANTVYITPPDKEISVVKGRISLEKPSSLIGPKPSVDVLFNSLANQNQKIVAIILSGTGSDGAKGLASLKGDNFLKIAQDPKTSKYDGMPNAAILSGQVQLILSPENMGQEIIHFFNDPGFYSNLQKEDLENSQNSFDTILKILGKRTGTDFSNYKTATLMRRLEKRLQMLEISDLKRYVNYLENNSKEIDEMFKMMLIGVTYFFRDIEAFNALENHLKSIIESKKENETLRIWVPGCSTGEEAYSIAILADILIAKSKSSMNIQLFATDIDERAINHARKAIYSASSVADIPDEIKEKYFLRKGQEFEVIKNIRSNVLFSKHDVILNPPFLRVDLISCRNLLIYFNAALQQQVLPIFHYAINNEGYLFLGKAETVGQFTDLFTTVDSKNKIYKRKRGGNIGAVKFSSFRAHVFSQKNITPKPVNKEVSLTDRVKETLFNTYENPYVVINSDFDVQEVFGDVRLFLSLPPGNIQVNLLKMVNPELQIELRGLLTKVIKESESFQSQIRKFKLFNVDYFVRIAAKPLMYDNIGQDLYMVIFEKLNIDEYINKGNFEDPVTLTNIRIKELETELNATKEHLQTYIEEIETSNEELQSLNEELQSTNEELQSSNEELETTNEELQSTNEEMQIAYAELRSIHDELAKKDEALLKTEANTRSLLNNNLQAFILIDTKYQIIDFNKKATALLEELSLKKIKTGKSIIDFLPSGDVESYLLRFKKAINENEQELVFEKQTKAENGEIYWLRININAANIGGNSPEKLTLGILDITDQKRIELKLNSSKVRLESLLNSQTHYVVRTDLDGCHTYWNKVFENDYGWLYEKTGIAGSSCLISVCEHHHSKVSEAVDKCLKNPGTVVKVELDKPGKNGRIRTTIWEFICIADEPDKPLEIQCMGVEITQINQLRENERLLNEAQSISKLGSWNFDFKKDKLTWSDGLYKVFDVDKNTFKQTHGSFVSLIDKEFQETVRAASQKAQETGESFHIIYKITTPKGEKRTIEEYGFSEKNEAGEVIRLFGTAQNITNRIEIEEKLKNSDRIFQYAKDMLCIAGFDGYFKVLNPAWSSILGWSVDELLSKPFIEFIHPDDRNKTTQENDTVTKGSGSVFF